MKFGIRRSYTSKLCLTPTMFSEIEKEPRALSVTQGGPQGMPGSASPALSSVEGTVGSRCSRQRLLEYPESVAGFQEHVVWTLQDNLISGLYCLG